MRAPIGFVTVGASDDATLPATTGMLFALYLEPDVIGGGVGRALLARAVDELARARLPRRRALGPRGERARPTVLRDSRLAADGTRKDYERDGAPRHELRYRRAL